MKNITLTLMALLIVMNAAFSQNRLYVNSTPIQGSNHFNAVQDAVDAADPSDMIFVSPGFYDEYVTVDKPLFIIGPGYRIANNFDTPITITHTNAIINELRFVDGSQGSKAMGLQLYDLRFYSTDLIEVSRCYYPRCYIRNSDNVTLSKSFIYAHNSYTHTANGVKTSIVLDSINNDILIENNWIDYGVYNGNSSTSCIEANALSGTLTVRNNVLNGRIRVLNYLLTCHSNILVGVYGYIYSASGSAIQNNVVRSNSHNLSTSVNLINQALTNIFVGYGSSGANGYSFDEQFRLKSDSPAIGYGIGGADCGIFGGEDPYVLSGLPSIPFIYDLQVPEFGTSGGGMDINIKVRSQE